MFDRGNEFKAEVEDAIQNEYGIKKKLITTRNPQANAMGERVHQTISNMIRVHGIQGKDQLDPDFGWTGVLSAVRRAVNSTVHTTTRATAAQLVFGRDAILNINFQADWEYIKERKRHRILQNNRKENSSRIAHTYRVGDEVMVKLDPNRKFGSDQYAGPYAVTKVNDNGTVQLKKAAQSGGAVYQTWNIRNITPCRT